MAPPSWGSGAYADVPPPVAVRTVQVGASSSAAEIEDLIEAVEAAGFSPVWTFPLGNGMERVNVGKLEVHIEAFLLKHALRRSGFEEAFERAYPELADTDFHSDFTLPAGEYPTLRAIRQSVEACLDDTQCIASGETVGVVRSEVLTSFSGASTARQRALSLTDSSTIDPQAASQHLQDIRVLVADEEDLENVTAPLVSILTAENRSTLGSAVILESALLLADYYHYHTDSPWHSYPMYKEIARNLSVPAEYRARAYVELVASHLEFARRDLGYYNELTRMAAEMRSAIPEDFTNAWAVVHLMEAEAEYYQGRFETAAEGLRQVIEEFPDNRRETYMARLFLVHSLHRTGDTEGMLKEAKALLEEQPLSPAESFYWHGERTPIEHRGVESIGAILGGLSEAEETAHAQAVSQLIGLLSSKADSIDSLGIGPGGEAAGVRASHIFRHDHYMDRQLPQEGD